MRFCYLPTLTLLIAAGCGSTSPTAGGTPDAGVFDGGSIGDGGEADATAGGLPIACAIESTNAIAPLVTLAGPLAPTPICTYSSASSPVVEQPMIDIALDDSYTLFIRVENGLPSGIAVGSILFRVHESGMCSVQTSVEISIGVQSGGVEIVGFQTPLFANMEMPGVVDVSIGVEGITVAGDPFVSTSTVFRLNVCSG